MKNSPIPRLDKNPELRALLLKYCRLGKGEIWNDSTRGHRVGCLDASKDDEVGELLGSQKAVLAVQDPPYNLVAFEHMGIDHYIEWSRHWVDATHQSLADNSSMYVWMGADQTRGFQPLPDFMLMMRDTPFKSRSFVTMRNQRGYGTQKNWMAIRQELLFYAKGEPNFRVEAEYTDIPKILRGYYKEINNRPTENLERSKAATIRAGNVWVDVQQVFYRMEENVNGCYAQKPLKGIDRILKASSSEGELVIDLFAHSGSTLLGAEVADRICFTMDSDPVYCEITIRRLERYRQTGKLGWQNGNPFETECLIDEDLQACLGTSEDMNDKQPKLL